MHPSGSAIAPDIPDRDRGGHPQHDRRPFFYLFAPAGTPAPILQKLNDLSRAALTDGPLRKSCEETGFDPVFAGGLEETRQLFEAERALWLPLVEASGGKTN